MTDLISRLESEEPTDALRDEVLLACGYIPDGVGLRTGTQYFRNPNNAAIEEKPNPLTSIDDAVSLGQNDDTKYYILKSITVAFNGVNTSLSQAIAFGCAQAMRLHNDNDLDGAIAALKARTQGEK